MIELLTVKEITKMYRDAVSKYDEQSRQTLFAILPYAQEIENLRLELQGWRDTKTLSTPMCTCWSNPETGMLELGPDCTPEKHAPAAPHTDRAKEKREMARLEAAEIRRASERTLMIFTLNVESTPATGHDLVTLLEQCVKIVRYNIGPEPLRSTKGPIYNPQLDRVGTWAIDRDAGTTLADRATEKREIARIDDEEVRRLAKLAVGE